MNRTQLAVAFVAFLAIYHAAGQWLGTTGKLYVVLGLLGLSFLLSLAVVLLQRRLQNQDPLSTSTDESPEPGRDDDDDLFPTPGPRLHGVRRYVDGVLGLCAALCPPILVSVYRGERLAWDGAFTGYHFLAMVAGITVYYTARPWLWRP